MAARPGAQSTQATSSDQDFPALPWILHSIRLAGAVLLNFSKRARGDGFRLTSPCSLPSSGSLESAHTLHT